jgi:hypothetical protein
MTCFTVIACVDGFEGVLVTGLLRLLFRHPTGSLYLSYRYFMREGDLGDVLERRADVLDRATPVRCAVETTTNPAEGPLGLFTVLF